MKTRHHSSFRISHSAFCILHCALALAVATATASAANDEFVIAENGFAKAAIVVPKDAPKSARYAARQLAKYLDQMTGANVPVADRPLRGYNTIRVGFPHDGAAEEIAISVPKRDLAEITGEGPRGPAYAVFDFLETLGCGFWNREIETIPSVSNLAVKVGYAKKEAPFFEWRNLSTQVYGSIDDCLKMRANDCSNVSDRKWLDTLGCHRVHVNYNHSFGSTWLKAKNNGNYDKHPEWYALYDPPRTNRSTWAICTTNPGTLDAVCAEIEAHLESHPWETSISLTPADTGTYCKCPECEKVVASDPSKAPTTLYIHFANKVARRLGPKWPKVKFVVLAYWSTVNPPTGGLRCDPNVAIAYAQLWRNHGRPITSCERFTPNIENWQRVADAFYYWDYYANFSDYIAPFPNWDIIAEGYKFYASHKFKGGFAQLPLTPNTPLGQHNVYLINRLQWNPSLDAEALSSNYIDHVYGPAAGAVRQFRDFAITCRDRQRWLWQGCYIVDSRQMLSGADCITYFNLSKEVEKKLARDPLRRIMGHRFPCSAYELLLYRYNDALAASRQFSRFTLPSREDLKHELFRRWGDSGSYYWSWWAESSSPHKAIAAFLKHPPEPTPDPVYGAPAFSVGAEAFDDNGSTVTLEKDPAGFAFARFTPEKRLADTRTFMDVKTDCVAWKVPVGMTNVPYYCFADVRVDARAEKDPAAAYFGIYNVPVFNGLVLKGPEETGSMRIERAVGDRDWRLAALGKFPLTAGSKVWVMAGFVNPPGDTDVRRFTFVQPDLLEKSVSLPTGEASSYYGFGSFRNDREHTQVVYDRFDKFKYLRVRAPGTAYFEVPRDLSGERYVFARVRASVRTPLVYDAGRFTVSRVKPDKTEETVATARFSGSSGELPWQLVSLGKIAVEPGMRFRLENADSDFFDWRDLVFVTPAVFEK